VKKHWRFAQKPNVLINFFAENGFVLSQKTPIFGRFFSQTHLASSYHETTECAQNTSIKTEMISIGLLLL
jgi:hypothetical protein